MKCLEVEELVLFARTAEPPREVTEHVSGCPRCHESLEVIAVLRPPPLEPVPTHLVARVMSALPVEKGLAYAPGHRVVTFLLGSATVLLAGAVAGGGVGRPLPYLIGALGAGAIAALAEPSVLALRP